MKILKKLMLIVVMVINIQAAMAELGQGISFNKYRANIFKESASFSFSYALAEQEYGSNHFSMKAKEETLNCDPNYAHRPNLQCESQSLEKFGLNHLRGDLLQRNPCANSSNYQKFDKCPMHLAYVSSCIQAHQSQCFTTRWVVSHQQAQDLANRVAFLENLLNTQHQEEIDALNNTMSNFREMVKQELLMDIKKTLEVVDGGEGKNINLTVTVQSENAEKSKKDK